MRKTPLTHNGGAKVIFPRAVSDGLLDLRALRLEIEEAEELAEQTGTPTAERRRWREYRDLLERALDVRIDLLDRSAISHDRAIGQTPTALCRKYEPHDPSHRELMALCGGQCEVCRPKAA